MRQQSYLLCITVIGLLFVDQAFATVEFEPGIGLGVEYTDNARLSPDTAAVDDLIAVGYVGASVSENEGPLRYDTTAALSKNDYTRDTFADQRYLNLDARIDWEMFKDRLDWFLNDHFLQRSVSSINSSTPDNLQDSNVLTAGANIKFPVSARQNFSLLPTFSQYYYEVLSIDNEQLSLTASWRYQMFRLTNLGLSLSTRKINYTEKNILGQSIEDTTFTTLKLTFSGQRLRSNFSGSLGSTTVRREGGDERRGFSGFLRWLTDLSSRSKFEARVSTDITDTSSAASSVESNPVAGGGDVQITADVIRNSVINLAYTRKDASLGTNISARYHKLTYSERPLDRVIRNFGAQLNYPVTPLLSGGVYVNYNRTEQLDTARLDKFYSIGGNLNYHFSRKLRGLIDLKYRTKESTDALQNYDEVSVFVNLVYGFGNVKRPARGGGF
ncbi:MAG TPA: hypothetical protein ENJ87_02250 [Gammaproteobacteria bacterium]|nr:hypothetical protein [Gammaproteobacteria bacterium]